MGAGFGDQPSIQEGELLGTSNRVPTRGQDPTGVSMGLRGAPLRMERCLLERNLPRSACPVCCSKISLFQDYEAVSRLAEVHLS